MNFSLSDRPETRLGLTVSDHCLDLVAARESGRIESDPFNRLEDVLHSPGGLTELEKQLGRQALETLEEFSIPLDRIRYRPPVIRPQKVIGIGLNYRDHAKEAKMKEPDEPLMFGMWANAIIGNGDAIEIPAMSSKVDYEAELGVIIGRRCRHVNVEAALDYVAGYTIFNDVSARDLQFADTQWTRGKTFDTFAPIGPTMTSARVLGDAGNLGIRLRLNGKTMQDSSTSNLIFNVPKLVSYCSEIMTLEPGDLIATGTPPGVGFARKPPVYLKSGDEIEIDIEGIGTLKNPVA